ncbi:ubiquinone/menaquinone biosynthesis C-methylase UbiE [Haloferula luteola]|uniref:Ubiquinone/menaquinone biosynthesis C-methylase UbiE n=1 Tax=Haloferula luteola TaxID=595692 RepID=A0A840UUX3_9BACT|nr:class I SAM-dependent methyltransferase [Haloferula luteola]MBB5349997.1 ubiquinone/menaquinone biosynthesis C-methylase UbiE [Haloferula luteola]
MTKRATNRAHEQVSEVLGEGGVAVDATAGNGHDTLFLARLVGPTGEVLAFDIQEAAIAASKARMEAAGCAGWVKFFQESHAELAHRVEKPVDAVMFNLGYLPGADHGVITRTEETLRALEAARSVVRPGGVVTVVCYPGHPGGDEEAAAVVSWAESQDGEVFAAAREGAPFLVVIRPGDIPHLEP